MNIIAVVNFPSITSIGSKRGIVIKVPRTDPFVKLNEFPKQNKIRKIKVETNKDGKSKIDE